MEDKGSLNAPADLNTLPLVDSQKSRRAVIAIAVFALCIDALTVRSIALLAPFLRSGLNISVAQFGYVIGSLTLGTLLVVLPVGSLSDRVDARKFFPIILIGVGLGFFIVSIQTAFAGLLAAMFVLGIMRAGIIPLVNRMITGRFERAQRGATMGIIYAAVPLGGFLGAVVLPALSEAYTWNTAYRVLGIIAIAGGWLSRNRIPPDSSVSTTHLVKQDRSSLRSKGFLILAAVYGLYALSLSADGFVTLYLVDVVAISAVAAGVFFGLIQLTGIGGRVFWGVLADRVFYNNRWWLLAIVNWLTVVAFILLTRLNSSSASWMIAVVMILIGLSVASSWGILSTVLGDVVKISSIAIATSVIYFITNIADVAGPILFGSALESTQSYQKTLTLFMGVAVFTALILTWMAWAGRLKLDGVKKGGSGDTPAST